LLQNLIVRPAAKGKFEVEAGERRRRAMLALADEKILARDHEVTCLVLEESAEAAVETSLVENFHRLAMNPADEAQAFAALVSGGATVEGVARRFGLTVRFVEGRLRLATLAPVVFEALASGQITLDIAKAFGATSDHDIQTRVFEQVSSGYYAPNPESVRRMVLSGTVRGSDPRARLVGRDAYIAAGGRIERELFDNDDSESWVDVALLENLATANMEEQAKALAAEQGLAWVKPTLDPYASHDLVEGLVRLPADPAPLTEAELARLDELDASYDENAAILEDEDSAEEAVAAAEAAIEAIERECQEIRARPPVIAAELKAEAGMILVLSRDGTPVLQPVFYGEREADPAEADGGIEVIPGDHGSERRRTTLSKRLVDELAMQRRDLLALHVASDPGLALDVMIFTLADADTHDWRARPSTTLRAPVPAGPIIGFEAKDAPASSALAELRSSLDESWRAGKDATSRFDLFRAQPDESRAAWLGYVVARSLEASLNMTGERQLPFQDHLGSLIGIDMAQWWRPTAANYFDRVSKQVILDALTDVGGLELSSRFASVKKGDLAMSAERVFAGTYITEVEVREKALAWVPEVMRFARPTPETGEANIDESDAESGVDGETLTPRELAA
jgi:ParB family chromosome partitioning protein